MKKQVVTLMCLLGLGLAVHASHAQRQPRHAPAPGAIAYPESFVVNIGEPIVVHFRNFPGNPGDWITVTKRSSKYNEYGEWHYLGGQKNGSLKFSGLPHGHYEVRGFVDWPYGGYNAVSKATIRVWKTH